MDWRKVYSSKLGIIICAFICCFLWGSAYPAIKVGYSLFDIASGDVAGKLLFAGYRFFLAGLLVLVFLIINKENVLKITKEDFKKVSLLGILQTTLQYTVFYIGLAYTTGVRGAILNGTGTFFSIIIAHYIYKNDKMSFNKLLGCIVGFLGVILVNFNEGSIIGDGGFSIIGEGFVIIAALLSSISAIYSKKISKDIKSSIVTGYQLLIGGFILIIAGIILGGRVVNFNLESILLLLYMAIISSVAFVIWTQLLKYNKVSKVSAFNFLIPIFGTILSGVFLGENIFNYKVIISLILVSLGIYIIYNEKTKNKVV